MHDAELPSSPEFQSDVASVATDVASVEDMVRRRGYAVMYHRVLAKHDRKVLKAADNLVSAAYPEPRTLDRNTKELHFFVSPTVLRGDRIASHVRVALGVGATPVEVLAAIDIALPEAGVVAFQHGFDVWREVAGAVGVVFQSDEIPQ